MPRYASLFLPLLTTAVSFAGCSLGVDDEALTGGSRPPRSNANTPPGSITPNGSDASSAADGAAPGTNVSPSPDAAPPKNLAPVDPSCHLPNAAFCDAFTKASPGGRAGALDDGMWSMARLGASCASASASFGPTPLNLCGTWQTVTPGGNDSQFCTTEANDPRWTEGFADNGSFNYLSARVRQPFDFANRTGTIQWEADARTSGSHGWWVENWITEDPVPGALLHGNDQLVSSRNAIGIVFSLNCAAASVPNGTAGCGKVGVHRIISVRDFVATDVYDPFAGNNASRCLNTEQGVLNKFQIKMSGSRVEVWGSDVGSTVLRQIAEADVNVGFSRGYVQLSHVHYNAAKAGVTLFQSYQWARVAFDGPQLAMPRAYQIADPLSVISAACQPANVYRMAYGVTDDVTFDLGGGPSTPSQLAFANVDVSGAVGARLTFNTTYVKAGDTLRYRLNGKTWRTYLVPQINTTWERQGFSVPVPVEDLVQGNNTLEIGTNSVPFNMPPNSMNISNIDLEVDVP